MRKQKKVGRSWLKLLENDTPVQRTRIISGVSIFLCAAVLIMETNGFLNSADSKTAADFIFIALLVIQFLFPENSVLLGIIMVAAGFVNIYFGGHVLGLLLYVFGIALFQKEGFFRTDKSVKVPFIFIIFLIALASQYRLGINKLIISAVNIVMAAAIVWGFLFLFRDKLKAWYSIQPPLDLSQYALSDRQILCLQGTRDRKSINDIAIIAGTTESSIRDEFVQLYGILDVYDRHDLYRMIEGRDIIFDKPSEKA